MHECYHSRIVSITISCVQRKVLIKMLLSILAVLFYHEKHTYSVLQRKLEIEERKQLYQWEKVEGLPGRIKCSKYAYLSTTCSVMRCVMRTCTSTSKKC